MDSLRAFAVVAVLVYHHDADLAPGGWLGVSLFFTLSGFLITTLLLAGHREDGRVDFGTFWARRLRRLLPASMLALGLAVLVGAIRADGSGTLAGDVRAAVLNVANWRFVVADTPYADANAVPSMVQHYWSLAIEEQFYVVLPIVIALAAGRRRVLGGIVVAAVGGSVLLQHALGGDLERVYYGTDTRLAELAVGVGLAMAWPWLRTVVRARTGWADLIGLSGAAAAAALVLFVPLDQRFVSSGALVAVTVVWVSLLVAALAGGRVAAAIERGPVPGLGRISYGVYLYHWPLYLLLTPDRVGFDGPGLLAVRVSTTLALAALSAHFVELPIRHGRPMIRRVAPVAVGSIVAVVAVSLAFGSELDPSEEVATIGGAEFVPAPVTTTSTTPPSRGRTVPEPSSTATSTTSTTTATTATTRSVAGPTSTSTPPTHASTTVEPTTTTAPPRPPRVLVVGDSTARVFGHSMRRVETAAGRAQASVLAGPGCSVLRPEVARIRDGFEYETPCEDVLGEAVELAEKTDPDVIVVLIGNLQLADAVYDGLDGYRSVLDPSVQSRYRQALAEDVAALDGLGVPVLWADVPVPEWDVDAMGGANGKPSQGSGEATTNDPERTAALNAMDTAAIARVPHVGRWAYVQALAGPDGVMDPDPRDDGLHLSNDAADSLMPDTFVPSLVSAYREVVARSAATLDDRSPTTWDTPVGV